MQAMVVHTHAHTLHITYKNTRTHGHVMHTLIQMICIDLPVHSDFIGAEIGNGILHFQVQINTTS